MSASAVCDKVRRDGSDKAEGARSVSCLCAAVHCCFCGDAGGADSGCAADTLGAAVCCFGSGDAGIRYRIYPDGAFTSHNAVRRSFCSELFGFSGALLSEAGNIHCTAFS